MAQPTPLGVGLTGVIRSHRCRSWVGAPRSHRIPKRVGFELEPLCGLERRRAQRAEPGAAGEILSEAKDPRPPIQLAERVGFEPTLPFRVNTLSKRAPSATRPSLRIRIGKACASYCSETVVGGRRDERRCMVLWASRTIQPACKVLRSAEAGLRMTGKETGAIYPPVAPASAPPSGYNCCAR